MPPPRLERIRSWRPPDREDLELRAGIDVTEAYPRHWHDEYQLCLAEAGGGALVVRGRALATPSGSLFIAHPGEVHANYTDERGCSFRSIYVPADVVRRLAGEPYFPRPVIVDPDVVRTFRDLHLTLEAPGARLAADSLLLRLFAGLLPRHAGGPPPAAPIGRERAAVRRAREVLVASYARNISLDQLARLSGSTPFVLSRAFRAEVGMPPHAYLTHVRILRAKALLRAGTPLADVAALIGFVDQSHFSRHFKRLVKLTPGRFAAASKNVQYPSGAA